MASKRKRRNPVNPKRPGVVPKEVQPATAEELLELIDDTPALVCRFLPDGTLTVVNREYARYFRLEKEDLVGRNFFEFIPEEAQDQVRRQFLSLDRESPTVTYEHQVIAPGGEVRWQRWTDRAVFDDEGGVKAYQSIGMDVTERKLTEERLAESEERYRRIVDNSLSGIFLIQDGRFVFVNRRLLEIHGVKREEELIGRHFWEFVHPEDREMVRDRGLRREKGEPEPDHYEFRALRKDGSSTWLEVRVRTTEWKGNPAVLGNVIEVTERRKAEADLREREEKYRLLAENTTDVIFIQDMALRPTYVSPSITALSGYTPEEALKLQMEDFLTEESLQRARESFSKHLGQAAADPGFRIPLMQYEYIRKDGTTFWGELKVKFLRDESGNPVALQGVLRDITERRRAEEELEARARELKEVNTTLKVLLDQRESESKEIGENILNNCRKLVFPYLERLETLQSDAKRETFLRVIRSNLENLVAPFIGTLGDTYEALTPAELRVADFIRHGMRTKEIASMLGISPDGVAFHRTNIRKKLGLQGKRINLRTYLQAFTER